MMSDSELRERLKSYRLLNETPVGTKMYPADIDLHLGDLLSEKDIDALMSLFTEGMVKEKRKSNTSGRVDGIFLGRWNALEDLELSEEIRVTPMKKLHAMTIGAEKAYKKRLEQASLKEQLTDTNVGNPKEPKEKK